MSYNCQCPHHKDKCERVAGEPICNRCFNSCSNIIPRCACGEYRECRFMMQTSRGGFQTNWFGVCASCREKRPQNPIWAFGKRNAKDECKDAKVRPLDTLRPGPHPGPSPAQQQHLNLEAGVRAIHIHGADEVESMETASSPPKRKFKINLFGRGRKAQVMDIVQREN